MPLGGFTETIGIGHGSLEIQTLGGRNYYITWLGGASTPSTAEEADRAIGFSQLRDRRGGGIVNNPRAYNSGPKQWGSRTRTNRETGEDETLWDWQTGAFDYDEDCECNVDRMGRVDRTVDMPCGQNDEGDNLFRRVEMADANIRQVIECKTQNAVNAGDNLFGLDIG
jgi:hypothetical protein